jgi:hypothetical protein
MSREQKNVKKLVGRIGDDYFICDHIFKYSDDFQGAVATVLRPVGQQEYEDAQDIDVLKDRFADLWGEAAQDGRIEESLEDFAQTIYDTDGDEALWDFSGYGYWGLIRETVPKLTEEDYPVFDCVGGGRSFSGDMNWDEIYNQELWALIQKYEVG